MFKLPLTFLCCFALIGGACAPAGGGSSDATVSGEGEGEGETEGDRDGGEGEGEGTGQEAAFAALYNGQNVQAHAGTCAFSCIAEGDQETCFINCLEAATMMSITRGCLGCVAASVQCVQTNCLGECVAGPDSPGCINCQCGQNANNVNCLVPFEECAGPGFAGACE